VNEAFARRFYPNQNVIGKTIRMLPPPELVLLNQPVGARTLAPYRTVVGMVADLKNTRRTSLAIQNLCAGTQFAGEGWATLPCFAVRTDQTQPPLASESAAGSRAGPQQPIADVIDDGFTRALGGAIAFQCACCWHLRRHACCWPHPESTGVDSYGVSIRTQEIGVRMALEPIAGRRVHGSAGIPETAAFGLGAGLVLALALTRLIATLLFGVRTADPGSTRQSPCVVWHRPVGDPAAARAHRR